MLTEIEEELRQNIEREEGALMLDQPVIGETDDKKEDCQYDETHVLDRLAANSIHESNCNPISWNSTSADNDKIADSSIVEDPVDIRSLSVANGVQDD